jgi:hypothetical protein
VGDRRLHRLRLLIRLRADVPSAVHQPPAEVRVAPAVEGEMYHSLPYLVSPTTTPTYLLLLLLFSLPSYHFEQYLVYKFLNTFIDGKLPVSYLLTVSSMHSHHSDHFHTMLSFVHVDLFAFIIKMPTMHRLSVFRDDIVFVIYLYQRWIYRVDETRPSEK